MYKSDQAPDPKSLYTELLSSFGKTLDRIGKGEKEDNNEKEIEADMPKKENKSETRQSIQSQKSFFILLE